MTDPRCGPDLPPSWRDALAKARGSKRVIVLGATDVGKSTFIQAYLEVTAGNVRLIDLDPGQKMLGPPGTAGLGVINLRTGEQRLDRFIFLGSTSASMLSAIARAAASLAADAVPFIVNTSGFVRGLGARLQAMTVASIVPDLIVEIGDNPILGVDGVETIRIGRSPAARSKSAGRRATVRQAAFDRALAGAWLLSLPRHMTRIEPAPPAPFLSEGRPVCALADEAGADMEIGILEAFDEESLFIRARGAPRPPRLVRLGKMWAAPGNGWKLLDKLSPSWCG